MYGYGKWKLISAHVKTRNALQCKNHARHWATTEKVKKKEAKKCCQALPERVLLLDGNSDPPATRQQIHSTWRWETFPTGSQRRLRKIATATMVLLLLRRRRLRRRCRSQMCLWRGSSTSPPLLLLLLRHLFRHTRFSSQAVFAR